ncbi:HDOD domain-containing protein [Phycisphaera mikurensis]|uniref:histidine kinase n=1 Tax=Phycisphaera mikurensis (strain NBRC 102666 / KCTC 22515 / FYK2301M01) TaxID=1142394 RepID=I0IGN0_PHYMF|nr:HDOD domain-containing protein [Phycisphaera mikurensis]MBB6442900.1 signal transduction histidine kinase/HD-like signal output (HDOD) protein [Phycisphaera mikurensis]BAM04418.1 putative two-component system sensor histidine kinase [Phycisphaera mikurensis NBRC 102666]
MSHEPHQPAPSAASRADPGEKARRVELLLRRLSSLPTLPAVATRLLEISADEASEHGEVVRLIESDPAMSTAILQLLAKLDRTSQSRPASIERAVLSLGFRAVRDAALAVGVVSTLVPAASPSGGTGLELRGFWTHSIATAAAAERLAAAHPGGGVLARDAFLPGLLHDIGKLALQVALPEAYVRVVEAARRHGLAMADAELRVLGIDHQTAGRRLATLWGLPPVLVDVIWLHGTSPLAMPDLPHANLVHLVTAADRIVRTVHLGDSGSHDVPADPAATLEAIGFPPAGTEQALRGLPTEVQERLDAMGLGEAQPNDPMRGYAEAIRNAHGELLNTNRRLREAAAEAAQHGASVRSLEAFFQAAASARGAEATAAAVAVSAMGSMGADRCLLAAPSPDATLLGGGGEPEGWTVVGTGGTPTRAIEPAELGLAWPPTAGELAEALDDAEIASMRPVLLREPPAAGDRPDDVAPLAMLLLGGETAGVVPAVLTAAWRAALAAAAGRERADHANERLAVANRRLDAAQSAMAGREADARLREIAAGAAHEMNNPLAVVSGRTEQLTLMLDGEALPLARAAHQASRRLGDLVSALGLFSRPPAARRRATDVARLAADVVESVRASKPLRREQMEPLEIDLLAGAGLGSVEIDPDMLRRSLDELITNAVRSRPRSFITVKLGLEAAAGDAPAALLVEMIDDGAGMDDRTLRHATDPFFSRHEAGRSAGLGLSRVTVWAAAHSGEVRLRPHPGGGTVATLRLALP